MSFTTEKEKSVSNHVVLAEIDMGRKQINWLNYCAGIWYYRFNTFKKNQEHSFLYGNFLFGPFLSSDTSDSGINFTPFDVGSCIVDGEGYTEQTSIANLISNNKSWYYDRDKTEFYIHVDGFDDPRNHRVIIGLTMTLSNKAKHINGGYYEPRIRGIFSISKSKDPLEFGIIRMDGGSMDLDNKDGFFDDFTDSIVFGQPTDIKYGIDDIDGTEMDYADYKQVGKFYIDDIDIGWPDCKLSLIDYRDRLSLKIPTNVYDQTTYPNLSDRNVGKSIPLPWGPVYRYMPICTNEEDGVAANYSFKLADVTDHASGIISIDKVVVDTTDVTAYKTDYLSDGYFTLPTAYYTPGQKVYVDFTGFDDGLGALDDNSLDVIEDILYTYLSIPYNATYYDTTEWAAIKDSTKDIGFILDKPTEIKKIIENIQQSNFGGFIVHDDGKYTFRMLDRTKIADETVLLNEYFTPPRIRYIRSRYLSKVSIGYAKDYGNNDYRRYLKDDLEADIVAEYKKSKWKEIETYLTNETDAKWLAEKYMDLWGKVRGEITTKTGIQRSEFEIDDVKNLTLDRRDRGWKGPMKTEIIGLQKDLLGTGKVAIRGLVIGD